MTRELLPNRRAGESFDLMAGSVRYKATVSYYLDGRVAEIFIQANKLTTVADTNARDAAIAFSFAMQHGADFQTMRDALSRDVDGAAIGPLGVALDIIAGVAQPVPPLGKRRDPDPKEDPDGEDDGTNVGDDGRGGGSDGSSGAVADPAPAAEEGAGAPVE